MKARAPKSEVVAMTLIVVRGKRQFTVTSRRDAKHGYRRIAIGEFGRIDFYQLPISQCRIFWSGMAHRLIERHLAGDLAPYRERPRGERGRAS